jgi:membrane fusion protein, multidrug efflux system
MLRALTAWGLFAAAGLFALTAGCGKKPEASPGKSPIQVEVLEIKSETFRETIVGSAVAEAKVEHRVSAEVGGVLKIQHVDRGDKVKKGSVLFEIDPEEFQLQVRARAASLSRAEAYLNFMDQELKRKEPLYKNETLSQAQWDKFQFDMSTARAEKDQARVAFEQAERDLRLATIKSPMTGSVLERYHKEGEVIQKGAVMAWIVDASRILFSIGLSGRELTNIRLGDSVDVMVDALRDQDFQGKVTRISGNANPKMGTFPVEVTVYNPSDKILPGMVGRVELSGAAHHNSIIIPLMAVQQQLEGTIVYLVEKDRAMKRRVMLGKVLGDRVVVLEGIKTGEQVVLVGQGRLESGDQVAVIQ